MTYSRDVFAMPSLMHNIRLTRPRDGLTGVGTYQKHVAPLVACFSLSERLVITLHYITNKGQFCDLSSALAPSRSCVHPHSPGCAVDRSNSSLSLICRGVNALCLNGCRVSEPRLAWVCAAKTHRDNSLIHQVLSADFCLSLHRWCRTISRSPIGTRQPRPARRDGRFCRVLCSKRCSLATVRGSSPTKPVSSAADPPAIFRLTGALCCGIYLLGRARL